MTRKKSHASRPTAPLAQSSALEKFRPLLSADDYAALLAELECPLPQALRANPLKVDPAAGIADWSRRYGWQIKPVAFCPDGVQLSGADFPPSQTIEHRMGFYYIQDAASMLPPELFDFSALEQPLILDMAASPGGKTTHLAARTSDRGLILANDASAARLTALRIVLSTWGAINAATTNFQGEKLGGWFPETFDAILLDAPCSMQSLRSSESHPMRPITAHEQQGLAGRQSRLLAAAVQALKVGGQVVYSTCTLSPEEDEGVLDALLSRYPRSVRIEHAAARLGLIAPGLTTAGGRDFHPDAARAIRLWPHRYGTSGFFAALITKTAPVEKPATGEPPARPFARTGLERLNQRELEELARQFDDRFGFDLPALLERQQVDVWRRAGDYQLIPEPYIARFASLPYGALGLSLGADSPDGFIPSHEFTARFGLTFAAGRVVLPDDALSPWLSGQDWRDMGDLRGYTKGAVVTVSDSAGRNLGRGKVLSDRLKNLLPRRLVA